MNKNLLTLGLATSCVLMSAVSAQASSFGFKFEGTYSQINQPTMDILLESVKIGDHIIEEFSFVTSAEVVFNDTFVGGNSGAASADTGDDATGGVRNEDATAADVVANLATNNINHIVDTEDTGSFVIDLKFGKVIDNLLIWERGMNSDLGVYAMDADGNFLGNRRVITRDMWFDAGFKIDTSEIKSAQSVGSLGINIFEDLGVDSGKVEAIRFFSYSGFNGPDWKFVGTTAKVPEPATMLGLGVVAGAGFLASRRKRAEA